MAMNGHKQDPPAPTAASDNTRPASKGQPLRAEGQSPSVVNAPAGNAVSRHVRELLGRVDENIKREFFDRVFKLRNSQEMGAFDSNRFPWQSRIVAEALLELAAREPLDVRAFIATRPSVFYGQVFYLKLNEILHAGRTVSVLIAAPPTQQDVEEWSHFVSFLTNEAKSRFSIRNLSSYSDGLSHFILVGDKAYRIEMPHPQLPWTEYPNVGEFFPERRARFSFNDPAFGKQIGDYADLLWGIAKETCLESRVA